MNKNALNFIGPSFEELESDEFFGVNGGTLLLKGALVYSAVKAVSTKATVTLVAKKASVKATVGAATGAASAVYNNVKK